MWENFDVPEYTVDEHTNSKPKHVKGYEKHIHMKEILCLFQGKEDLNISPEILQAIMETLPEKIDQVDDINIKQCLREMKLSKYVAHAQSLYCHFTGKQPPYIRREVEEKLTKLKQICNAYNMHKPSTQNNFLNYYYVIYKLLESMSERELLPYIPLLRSRIRLKQHDAI